MNEHTIKLINRKQLLYRPIYAINPVELEILKSYIEIYLKPGFIRSSKSPTSKPILFDKKFEGSLHVYIDY